MYLEDIKNWLYSDKILTADDIEKISNIYPNADSLLVDKKLGEHTNQKLFRKHFK
jgi:hypothetical protein